MNRPSTHDEVELTYDVDDDFVLSDLDGRVSLDPEETLHLVATYFDTADQRLGAARTTLRRRTGGDDAGWHAKLPGRKGARKEVRLPLGRSTTTVPLKLRKLLNASTRGEALVPVAELRTERLVRRVRGADGSVLAEVVDDRVEARRLGTGTQPPAVWRELEVELVGGDRELLDAIDGTLQREGVRPAGHSSKLARALGRSADDPEPLSRRSSARAVAQRHLAEQVQAVVAQDPLVRLDAPDAVHRMRVATRRLRSALKSWRPLLDVELTEPLRGELTWLAAELGAARDAEVLRDRLLDLVADEAPDVQVTDVHAQLTATMHGRCDQARRAVLAALDGPRYQVLLAALDELGDAAPWTAAAKGSAREVLAPLMARSHRRLAKRVRTAVRSGDDAAFHDVRKAAKESRYAAEALTPAFGKPATKYAKAVAGVQEVLGENQDSVVTRELLLELATHDTTGAAFTYGRLHAAEELRGAGTREGFEEAWRTTSRSGLRSWFT